MLRERNDPRCNSRCNISRHTCVSECSRCSNIDDVKFYLISTYPARGGPTLTHGAGFVIRSSADSLQFSKLAGSQTGNYKVNDATVLRAAKRAHRIFARSDRFRAKLETRGLRYHELTGLERDLVALIA